MQKIKSHDLPKKNRNISLRISKIQKEAFKQYCETDKISYSDFIRTAIRRVINE